MTETISFANEQKPNDPERDINGYYVAQVIQPYDTENPHFCARTVIKLANKLHPAPGTDDVKIGVTLNAILEKRITTPTEGFTILLRVAIVSKISDTIIALLVPVDGENLVRAGINYVETILITIPFSNEDYVSFRPNSEYYVTIDLAQPEVEHPISE